MPNFFAKTPLLDVIMVAATLLSIAAALWPWVQWLLANSHYVWITDCEPTCSAWAPFGNFRPALGTEHGTLDPELQKTMLLFGWLHWFVVLDAIRPLYPALYWIASGYIREPLSMIVAAVFFAVFLIWEVVKTIVYGVAYITPSDWPIAFGPGATVPSGTSSVQYNMMFWGSVATCLYNLVMLVVCIAMSALAHSAKKTEVDEGSVPTPFIGVEMEDKTDGPFDGSDDVRHRFDILSAPPMATSVVEKKDKRRRRRRRRRKQRKGKGRGKWS